MSWSVCFRNAAQSLSMAAWSRLPRIGRGPVPDQCMDFQGIPCEMETLTDDHSSFCHEISGLQTFSHHGDRADKKELPVVIGGCGKPRLQDCDTVAVPVVLFNFLSGRRKRRHGPPLQRRQRHRQQAHLRLAHSQAAQRFPLRNGSGFFHQTERHSWR